jgi:hypothetical protein
MLYSRASKMRPSPFRDAARLRFQAPEAKKHQPARQYGLTNCLQTRGTELKFVIILKIHIFEALTGYNSQILPVKKIMRYADIQVSDHVTHYWKNLGALVIMINLIKLRGAGILSSISRRRYSRAPKRRIPLLLEQCKRSKKILQLRRLATGKTFRIQYVKQTNS